MGELCRATPSILEPLGWLSPLSRKSGRIGCPCGSIARLNAAIRFLEFTLIRHLSVSCISLAAAAAFAVPAQAQSNPVGTTTWKAGGSLEGGSALVINEVDADQVSTDAAEFIELYSPGGALALDDHFIVLYNGGSAGDAEYNIFDLDTQAVPSDGFFVVGPSSLTVPNTDYSPSNFNDTNAVQNGADGVALWFDTTGLLVEADFDGTSPGTPPAGAVLVDALVYGTGDADDVALIAALTPGQPQIDEGANGNKDIESNSRFPDGGAALDTSTYVAQAPTPGATNGSGPVNAWTDLGFALAGVSGDPSLVGTGTLLPSSANSVDLTNAAPSAPCALFLGFAANPVPFKGGMLVPIPFVLLISLNTDVTGAVSIPFSWPATGANPGTVVLQYGIQDAAATAGVSLSNAIQGDAP
ncbi:MAG: hypothetical protein ACI9EF_002201 [Pseudohongiellaceae bacterium]|jgi:hypothetical protein